MPSWAQCYPGADATLGPMPLGLRDTHLDRLIAANIQHGAR